MKFKKAVSAFAALTMAISVFASLGVTANAADTTTEQTLTGHTAIVGTAKTVADYEKAIYLNSWAGQGGAAALSYTLDSEFDASKVKSATLQLYVESQPNKNRSTNVKFHDLAAMPTFSDLTPTTYADGKVNVYQHGESTTKRYNFKEDAFATVTSSAYTNTYMITNKYNDVDVTDYIKSLTSKKGGDSIYIGIDIDDAALDTKISGYGSTNPPKLTITYTDAVAAVLNVSYKCGETDLTTAVADTYSKTIDTYVGQKVTPVYPATIVSGGHLYQYVSGGVETTIENTEQTITLTYKDLGIFTAPTAKTTGSENGYSELVGNTPTSVSTTTNKSIANAKIGETYVLEYDAFLVDGAWLDIRYGIAGTGPNLTLTSTSADDENVSITFYSGSGTGQSGMISSDAYYTSGTWAHIKAECKEVANTTSTNIVALDPISVTVTPSIGTVWEDKTSIKNTNTIGTRNLNPSISKGIKTFDGFIVSGNDGAYIANMVTYSIPAPVITTGVASTVDATSIPAIDDAAIFTNAADNADTATYAALKAKGTLKTIYAKIDNATTGVAPKIKIGDAVQTSKWTPVTGTNIYFAQFIGAETDFADGGAFANVTITYDGATEKAVVWTPAE